MASCRAGAKPRWFLADVSAHIPDVLSREAGTERRHLATTVLLRREGWNINAKRVYRLYDEENLKVRSVERKKIARRQRVPQAQAIVNGKSVRTQFAHKRLAPQWRLRKRCKRLTPMQIS